MNFQGEEAFKAPSLIPQDLQLIQDIIGELHLPLSKTPSQLAPPAKEESADEDDVCSTDNGGDSENEVENDILKLEEGDATACVLFLSMP